MGWIQTGWTTSSRLSVSTSRTDRLLSTEVIPFMRPISISFVAEGLRPWTPVTPYFNGVDVSQWVLPTAGALNDPLVAGATGSLSGQFRVPASTFRNGNTVFSLSDDNSFENATSFGQAVFQSAGAIETRQATATTTRTTTLRQEPVFEFVGFSGGDGGGDGGGGDPLAQTFFIDTKTSSQGCFVTKIRLWFQSKDSAQPIEVELRNVVNGYPGGVVLGKAVLAPAAVAVSANATLHTDFEFPVPVFVNNKSQYSFVIKTNSTKYQAWVATMGQPRVDKNESVAKQPNAGVMFLSSNDTTWSPDQMSDVKFQVFVAQFSTNPGTVVGSPVFPNYKSAFDANVQTYNGTSDLRVFAINHGLQVGSTTEVSVVLPAGVTDVNGISAANINGNRTVKAIDPVSFKITCGGNATSSGLARLDRITFEPNAPIDELVLSSNHLVFSGSGLKYDFKGISGKTMGGTQTPFVQDSTWTEVIPNTPHALDQPKLVASFSETAARFGGLATTRVKATLTTSDPYVSPVIDLDATGLVANASIVNFASSALFEAADVSDWVEETSSKVGVQLCRYVIKPITLLTPATSIRVKYAANCVVDNAIEVYYRTIGSGETARIEDKAWTLFNPVDSFVNTPDAKTFFDYEYDVTGLAEYKTLQVKLVLKAKNSAVPPQVRDFRVLALAV